VVPIRKQVSLEQDLCEAGKLPKVYWILFLSMKECVK
jgi:hypothetical protein